jgi:hypothetical protein
MKTRDIVAAPVTGGLFLLRMQSVGSLPQRIQGLYVVKAVSKIFFTIAKEDLRYASHHLD